MSLKPRLPLLLATSLAATTLVAGCGGDDDRPQPAAATPTVNITTPAPAGATTSPATPSPEPRTSEETSTTATASRKPATAQEESAAASQRPAQTQSAKPMASSPAASLPAGSSARVLAQFAAAWRAENYRRMASLGVTVGGLPVTPQEVQQMYGARKIRGYRIGASTDLKRASVVGLTVEMAVGPPGRPHARLGGPVRLVEVDGRWRVVAPTAATLPRVR